MEGYKIKILFLLLFLSVNGFSQRDYRFYSFNENNGLRNNLVTSISEDGNGFMWIGTYAGLIRYDGYTFTEINSGNDSLSLKGNTILSLEKDIEGNIWIATESGVSKYDINTESFYSFSILIDDIKYDYYQADRIFTAQNGKIRYFSKRLFELDTKRNTFVPVLDDKINGRKINDCFFCNNDRFVMVSQENHTIYYTDFFGEIISEISLEGFKNGNPFQRTFAILELSEGKFYLGSDNGLFLIDFNEKSINKIDQISSVKMPAQITTLFRNQNGEIWIGSNGEQLFILPDKDGKPEKIEADSRNFSSEKLNSFTIFKMYQDSRGIMWFGTWNGLAMMQPTQKRTFYNLQYPESDGIIPSNTISSFAQAPSGHLAIGTDGGGLAIWDKKSNKSICFKNPDKTNKMPNSSVLAMAFDSKGNLYEGGYKHPLHRFSADFTTDELYKFDPSNENSLENDDIRALYMENDTMLWVLTNGGGLTLFNPQTKRFKRIKEDKNGNKPCSPYGICLSQDKDKTLIVGTYHGMYTFDYQKNIIKNYSYNTFRTNSLSHNWVNAILTDSKNRIWVGTNAGLNLFDKETGIFKVFDKGVGFDNIVCHAILEDSDGALWIATSGGIAKFLPEKNIVERIYVKNDGISTDCFSRCSAIKDSDGKFFFGTNNGLVYFDPKETISLDYIPKPIITALSINYEIVKPNAINSPLKESISKTKEIVLSDKQSTFSLQFASLKYIEANACRYAYRIVSPDNNWNYIGKRRVIDFTKLKPGKYVIEFFADNADGAKSESNFLTVIILPPWYLTLLAKIIYVLLTIAAIYLVHNFRVRNLKKQKEILETEVLSRTKELREVNNILKVKNQELNQSAEEIQTQRDQLFDQNAKLQEANDVINSKNLAIRGSITYAQTIQTALLTKETDFYKYFETSFVYHPKDIVSGDFFWLKQIDIDNENESVFVSVIDCTGHGVPGAFMSIIANSVLKEIVETLQITSPCEILNKLSYNISTLLAQDYSDNKDGMDMALCRLDRKKGEVFSSLTFSGARMPLYLRHINEETYIVEKADRMSVAGGVRKGGEIERKIFSETKFNISLGDIIYMITDGLADMSNAQRKRFSRANVLQLLEKIHPLEMDCQAAEIEKTISSYSIGAEQRDDISVLGIKIVDKKLN